MARGRSPVMQRRRLAAELHRLRAASHRTLEEVAEYLECSPAKISRIENNQVTVRIQDARELLDLYGVEGDRREELLRMVREARSKGWWSGYAEIMDEGMETLLSLEDEAATILVYETNLVADLLQTPAYAQECLNSWTDVELARVQRQVELRMARQRILDGPDAPDVTVILDESALRRPVGDRTVMREQTQRLLDAAARDTFTIRILPFAAGPHQAMGFPFRIFGFNGGDPRVVHVEMLERAQFIDRAEDVGRYWAAFEQVQARALDVDTSRELIMSIGSGD